MYIAWSFRGPGPGRQDLFRGRGLSRSRLPSQHRRHRGCPRPSAGHGLGDHGDPGRPVVQLQGPRRQRADDLRVLAATWRRRDARTLSRKQRRRPDQSPGGGANKSGSG